MARRARFRVGPQRIAQGLNPSSASYTRAIRSQMVSIEKGFTRLLDTVKATTPAAVEAMLRPVFDRSQILVPVKTGVLKASGYLEIRTGLGDRVVGEVGYGKGNNPPYAPFVHENLDAHHAVPTQAKFLEQAVNEELAGALDQAADVYRQTLGL